MSADPCFAIEVEPIEPRPHFTTSANPISRLPFRPYRYGYSPIRLRPVLDDSGDYASER